MSVELAIVDFIEDLQDGQPLCFDNFITRLTACTLSEVPEILKQVQDYCDKGFYAVGFVCYEAAAAFDKSMQARAANIRLPLAEFAISKKPCTPQQYQQYLNNTKKFSLSEFTPVWSQQQYSEKISAALEHISAGDTYQINLTFALDGKFTGDALGCYKNLAAAQRAKYSGCYISDTFKIISASPELFFSSKAGLLTAKPMKGTRPRGMTNAQDKAFATQLATSAKDRAENAMIVDLLRNDLGRICEDSSVQVVKAFECEKYPTLWQMTSTITAKRAAGKNLSDIFAAIFPCGSITGAPKIKTTEIIAELEESSRGVYCGAFGIVLPGGDCVFNVPIRTLTVFDDGDCVYNVGSGIVADSSSEDEYDECILKSKILTTQPIAKQEDFEILETILFKKADGFYLLDKHLKRMAESAEFFDFCFDKNTIKLELQARCTAWQKDMRVRLMLKRSGEFVIENFELNKTGSNAVKKIRLADKPINSLQNPFVYHKTTRRSHYDKFRNALDGAFEILLYNSRGELTEGTITNIALKINGKWITPSESCGLLAGLQRQKLLDTGEITEGVLTIDDLKRCEGIKIFNSLRGVMNAELL